MGADVTIVHLPEEEEDAKETKMMVGGVLFWVFGLMVSPRRRCRISHEAGWRLDRKLQREVW